MKHLKDILEGLFDNDADSKIKTNKMLEVLKQINGKKTDSHGRHWYVRDSKTFLDFIKYLGKPKIKAYDLTDTKSISPNKWYLQMGHNYGFDLYEINIFRTLHKLSSRDWYTTGFEITVNPGAWTEVTAREYMNINEIHDAVYEFDEIAYPDLEEIYAKVML